VLLLAGASYGLIWLASPGLAWVGPVVLILGMPGWLALWIGGALLVRGRAPGGVRR